MIELKWSPTFEIGVEEIDPAHRNQFAMANEIRQAIGGKDPELGRTRVEAFIAAAHRHFAEEEKFLDDVGYAEARQHKAYPALLLDKAERLKEACAEKMIGVEAENCYGEVLTFLIDDVVRGDHQFKSYLDHRGLTRVNR